MSASFEPTRRPSVLAGLCALLGLVFIFGGARLVALGGSSYFLVLGLALLATGILTWIRHPAAAWLFAATTFCTLVWAITESGFDAWALLPRVVPLATLGLWFALPGVQRALATGRRPAGAMYAHVRRWLGPGLFLAAVLLVVVVLIVFRRLKR